MYQFSNFQRAEIGPPRQPTLADGFEGVCQIEKTYVNDTRFGAKFFCEMTVMSSNHPENPVGQLVVWKQDLTKKDVADNAIFQWAAGVLGVHREDEATVNALRAQMKPLLDWAIVYQDNNNFTKKYVVVRARGVKTQSNRDFTACDFYPYVPNGG